MMIPVLIQGFPEILKGFPLSPYITRYLPPFDEFEVDRCILPRGASTVFPAIPGPSIFLVVVGEGTMCTESSKDVVMEGDALFAPANTEISVSTPSELHLYRAGVNSRFFQILWVVYTTAFCSWIDSVIMPSIYFQDYIYSCIALYITWYSNLSCKCN